MPNIFLSPPTYQRLLRRVTSFEDKPEDVIARLLDETDPPKATASSPVVMQPSRAAPGSVLPLKAYWIPILEVLEERGGAVPTNDVIDALESRMADVFTERDLQMIQSGAIRWRYRARFARLRMREHGLLSDSSDRGIWEITPLGQEFLKQGQAALEQKDATGLD